MRVWSSFVDYWESATSWLSPIRLIRVDPVIWKATSLYAEGDVGGFDANSGSAFEIHREGRTIAREPVESSDWKPTRYKVLSNFNSAAGSGCRPAGV